MMELWFRYFHAHMDPGDKERVFDAWKDGSVKVVVATVAFGMGINKADGMCSCVGLRKRKAGVD